MRNRSVDEYVFIGCALMFMFWAGHMYSYQPPVKACPEWKPVMYQSKGDAKYWANYWGKK